MSGLTFIGAAAGSQASIAMKYSYSLIIPRATPGISASGFFINTFADFWQNDLVLNNTL